MIAEAMPLATKILFLAVALGLLTPALYNVWRAGTPRKPPRRRRDPYKPQEVSQRRYSRLWVVDRDHEQQSADPSPRSSTIPRTTDPTRGNNP